MRLVRPTRKACDRARLYASLRLDDELSELESRLLATHLAQCGPCRAFGEDVASFTAALRAARAEAPTRLVAVSARRARPSIARRPVQLSAAALVLGALGLGSLLGAAPAPRQERSTAPSSPPAPATRAIGYGENVLLSQKLLILEASVSGTLGQVAGGFANRAL